MTPNKQEIRERNWKLELWWRSESAGSVEITKTRLYNIHDSGAFLYFAALIFHLFWAIFHRACSGGFPELGVDKKYKKIKTIFHCVFAECKKGK